jgi:hypothetical protein
MALGVVSGCENGTIMCRKLLACELAVPDQITAAPFGEQPYSNSQV